MTHTVLALDSSSGYYFVAEEGTRLDLTDRFGPLHKLISLDLKALPSDFRLKGRQILVYHQDLIYELKSLPTVERFKAKMKKLIKYNTLNIAFKTHSSFILIRWLKVIFHQLFDVPEARTYDMYCTNLASLIRKNEFEKILSSG